eukprot:32267-Eustigmatos_ZCMA.PRE.1
MPYRNASCIPAFRLSAHTIAPTKLSPAPMVLSTDVATARERTTSFCVTSTAPPAPSVSATACACPLRTISRAACMQSAS